MSALKITVREHEDGLVLVVDGEIDMATEDQFQQAVREAVRGQRHNRVVLDCVRLGFIDSSGLRVLIQTHRLAKEHSCTLFVAAPTSRVAQVLRVTAVDTRIPVLPTVEAALAAPLRTPSAN